MARGNVKTNSQLASSPTPNVGEEIVVDEIQPSTEDAIITDPLGLYPKNSEEWTTGEPPLGNDRTVSDPLNLYQDKSEVSTDVVMSKSIPFLKQPAHLTGILPGDRGFDPLNLAASNDSVLNLNWYREAELKHARIAMLATVGWAVSELSHNSIASTLGLDSILDSSDKVPSVLNGGLGQINPYFWLEVICAAAVLEFISIKNGFVNGKPGEFNFDPLGLGGNTDEQKFYNKEAELFNGRLAMLAITGFAIQEFAVNDAVVNQTPFFFKFFGDTVAQLLSTGGAISV